MPNHVYSKMTITGNKEQLKDLIEKVTIKDEYGKDTFDFTRLYPTPEELKNRQAPFRLTDEEKEAGTNEEELKASLIAKYGSDEWYNWNVSNWGTKWGMYSIDMIATSDSEQEGYLSFYYQTAWSPATGLLQHISSLYPELQFNTTYADEGGGFVCTEIYEKGASDLQDYDWHSEEGIECRNNVGMGPDEDEEELLEIGEQESHDNITK